jgi:hypothetical protein
MIHPEGSPWPTVGKKVAAFHAILISNQIQSGEEAQCGGERGRDFLKETGLKPGCCLYRAAVGMEHYCIFNLLSSAATAHQARPAAPIWGQLVSMTSAQGDLWGLPEKGGSSVCP